MKTDKLIIDQMIIHIMMNTRIPIFNLCTSKHNIRSLFDRYQKHFVLYFFNCNDRKYSIAVSEYLNESGMNNELILNELKENIDKLKKQIMLERKFNKNSISLEIMITEYNGLSDLYNKKSEGLNNFIKEFRKFKCHQKNEA